MNVSCYFFMSAVTKLRVGGYGKPDKWTKPSLGFREGFREEVMPELRPEVEGQG